MFYSIYYDRGARESNQDSVALHKVTTKKGELIMALVSDGCGGMDDGEYAGGYVAEKMSAWFYEELIDIVKRSGSFSKIEHSANRKIFSIHEELRKNGNDSGKHLAATFTMLIVYRKRFLVLWLGDSPGVALGKGVKFLTSVREKDSFLTKCVGCGRFFFPMSRIGRVKKNTAIMLTTDGIGKYLTEKRISGPLLPGHIDGAKSAERRLKTIGKLLKDSGESDNMSAVYIRF